MTLSIIIMIIIGIIFIFASFFISEKFTKKESDFNIDLLTVNDDYEFSERELNIIKRKIEDVIAKQAKDILYETNESLSSMANEKTMALGDYAVAVCDQIEKNHKEVMFLYSMLDDKQKEIMNTVREVDDMKKQISELLTKRITVEQIMPSIKRTSPQAESEQTQSTVSVARNTDILSETQENTHNNTGLEQVASHNVTAKQQENIPGDSLVISDMDEKDVFDEMAESNPDLENVLDEEFEENANSNDIILEMHRNGNSIVDIAKQLGLGIGEVKLVIDLYQGEMS